MYNPLVTTFACLFFHFSVLALLTQHAFQLLMYMRHLLFTISVCVCVHLLYHTLFVCVCVCGLTVVKMSHCDYEGCYRRKAEVFRSLG